MASMASLMRRMFSMSFGSSLAPEPELPDGDPLGPGALVRRVGLGLEPLSDRLTLPSWTARFQALASARACVLFCGGSGHDTG